MAPPIVRRAQADHDLDAAAYWHADNAGADVALRSVAAVEAEAGRLAASPGLGSPRIAEAVGLPGLRSRRVPRFPYLILYRAGAELTVERLLHDKRDIPALLVNG